MTPKEFQKSNLAVELKTGRKRLEDALHGLSDEQCNMGGATRSGSVVNVLTEIVTKEFLALMEVSDRLPSLRMNLSANADGRTPTASGAAKDAANTSVENLLAEFAVLRSGVIRRIEDPKQQGANFDAKHAYLADVCVTRFNEQIDEIERWRSSEIVGFSAARLRAEAREAELNHAIVELSREDFLAGNFDLKSLFSLQFDRFYSEDFVLWLGAGETNGRTAAFQRMADVLEPINTLLEMGLASIVSFRATASAQDGEGNFITDWETVLGGTYSTGIPVRWRTVRAWKSRAVIAERHRGSTIAEAMRRSMLHASMLGEEELRIFEELISRFDSLSEAEMSVVGVTPEWSAKDLLAHLAYWERAAAEEIREFEAGRSPAKKCTRSQMERINREVVSANRATPRQRLREELILARSEIVAAMKRAPKELEERSPLAQIVYSHCLQHRGHHLEQLRAWVAGLGKTL